MSEGRISRRFRTGCRLLPAACFALLSAWPAYVVSADRSFDESTLATNRARLEAMSAHDRARIAENFERFQSLLPAEREELRRLHAAIEGSGAEREALLATMDRYIRWLDSLTPSQRERLDAATSAEARFELVQSLVDEQAKELAGFLERLPAEHAVGEGQLPARLKRIHDQLKESGLTQREEAVLAKLPLEQKFAFVTALALKYAVPLPKSASFFNRRNPLAEVVLHTMSQRNYPDLSAEEKKQFHDIIVALFLLPEPDRKTLIRYLEGENGPWKVRLRSLRARDPNLFWKVLSIRYYAEHPAELSASERAVLEPVLSSIRTHPWPEPPGGRFQRKNGRNRN